MLSGATYPWIRIRTGVTVGVFEMGSDRPFNHPFKQVSEHIEPKDPKSLYLYETR